MKERRFLTEIEASHVPSREAHRARARRNIDVVLKSEVAQRREGIFAFESPEKMFTVDGSLRLNRMPAASMYKEFYEEPGRAVRERNTTVLRGPRYLCAIDPNTAFEHKTKILREDFDAALDTLLKDQRENGGKEQFMLRLGALDYVKNTTITFLNALYTPEKFGAYRLDDSEYQKIRSSLLRLARNATQAQYAYMIGDEAASRRSLNLVAAERTQIEYASAYLNWYYKNPTETNKEVEDGIKKTRGPLYSRPELAHPFLIGAAAIKTVERRKGTPPETIVGLATGATEYAFVLEYAFQKLAGASTQMVVAPVSLNTTHIKLKREAAVVQHAAKIASGEVNDELQAYLTQHADMFKGKSILIADDNSSTGKTLQVMADTLAYLFGPREVDASVAESDVIRKELIREKIGNSARGVPPQIIATPEAFEDVVGILPISQELQSNTDVRKLREFQRVWKFYEQRKRKGTFEDDIVRNVIRRTMLSSPYLDFARDPNRDEGIYMFWESTFFLSNFEPVDVEYEIPLTDNEKNKRRQPVRTYPSVEHGYQAAKFPPDVARKIPRAVFEEVNEFMRDRYGRRGEVWRPVTNADELMKAFTDRDNTASMIKAFSDALRDRGYIRDDWFDIRLPVMIDLLVKKFKQPEYREKLLATGNKYLAEGNFWADTYWGVYVRTRDRNLGPKVMKLGFGKNMLGFALMELRAQLRDLEAAA